MKITMKTDGEYVKGFTLDCSVIETLVINKALYLLSLNKEIHPTDKKTAIKILKTKIERK